MLTLIIFVAVLAVLVLSHEFGHFIAARINGIKVEEFGFGFPPRVFGIQLFKKNKLKKIAEGEKITVEGNLITDEKTEIDVVVPEKRWRFVWGNKDIDPNEQGGGTIYSLNLLPLGGFCKIKGENRDALNEPDSFTSKKPWQRALVLAAGVLMNIVLAVVLLSVGFMVGLPQMTDQLPAGSIVKDRRLEIIQVLPGKPAEQAGIQTGDAFVKVGSLNSPRLKEMQDYVDTHKKEKISVTVRRDDKEITKEIQPIIYPETGKGGLGVAIAEVGTVSYPWYRAIYEGVLMTGAYLKEIIVSLVLFFKGLLMGAGAGDVAGPVGIAVMTGRIARLGFSYLIQFTAVLSLNLAIINILPIPALDGGRLLFLLIEKIRRRPVAEKLEQIMHTIGWALLMILIIAITVKDVNSFRGAIGSFFSRLF